MAKDRADEPGRAPLISNRKAYHRYEVLEKFECGVALRGPEVKSLRLGRASLDEAYARIKDGELWLLKMHVDEYAHRGQLKLDPTRPRKLLLHRREITQLADAVERKGLTLVPLKVFWNERGIAKVELGLVRGKKLHDKRETEKAKTAKREMDRAIRRR
jgi:SsrA-binding protein